MKEWQWKNVNFKLERIPFDWKALVVWVALIGGVIYLFNR